MYTCIKGEWEEASGEWKANGHWPLAFLGLNIAFRHCYMETILSVISILLITGVFLSLVRNDFWVFKILEYPRLQKLMLVLTILVCWLLYWPLGSLFHKILFAGLCLSVIYLVYKIGPYTIFNKKEILKIPSTTNGNDISIFAANVLQDNHQYQKMIAQIRLANPDLVYLVETDQGWANAMKELEKDYPFSILNPLDNTYGLLFYSRYEIKNGRINYLVKKKIPSIEATIELPSGNQVKVWGLHPEPPVPGENLYSTAKDKELMKVAIRVQNEKFPCIVFGDLNDVAWSHTTELFRKVSGLLDPRRGRGFYSTFSAHHWFIRYPLDYIFCSSEFGLVKMKRLPHNGSDHFATLTHLALKKEMKKLQEEPRANQNEQKEAFEIASGEVKS